jgi:Uma2 family endonuclease
MTTKQQTSPEDDPARGKEHTEATAIVMPSLEDRDRIVVNDRIRIPATVTDFGSFRKWCKSVEYPRDADVFWLAGTIWIGTEGDEVVSQLMEVELIRCLGQLVKETNLGYVCGSRMRLIHEESCLSVEPDLTFFSTVCLRSGRVRLPRDDNDRILELVGSPNLVVEVTDDNTEVKDDELEDLYFAAGIDEYWRFDVRGEKTRFDIFRRGAEGFDSTPCCDGRVRSSVFGRSFELLRTMGPIGLPEFTLEVTE